MHSVKIYLLGLAAALCWAVQLPGPAVADVIILNDGRQIETPRAIVEGSQVFYYKGEKVYSMPHSQVREIRRGEAETESTAEKNASHPNHFYRLVFTDGRTVQIDDYNDAGNVIRYTKYDVRVTMDKSVIRTITRVSEDGEQVVFRHGEALKKAPPVQQRKQEEAALRRMSEESRERAVYSAIVDEKAMEADASKERQKGNKRCLDKCLQTMLACRNKCAEILDTLKSRKVGETDPAYVMIHKDVVTPCIRQCVTTESACRYNCDKAPATSQP
ncbi:MAG: hypothetical protein ABIL58_09130 [Pseudomonadota bacterium]